MGCYDCESFDLCGPAKRRASGVLGRRSVRASPVVIRAIAMQTASESRGDISIPISRFNYPHSPIISLADVLEIKLNPPPLFLIHQHCGKSGVF